ncbi:MAG: helix-turn-helix transcriptional regulator [Bacteroidales bacterium]|nr:helix-turn-helix transcriptional regulator [Bacteroidales bacterium]
MNKRLQQFLSAENISQSQFAETIGVARASISHILAGRNKPGFDFIESMARHFPELNLEWLITGRGKMYSTQKTASEAPVAPIPSPSPLAGNGLFPELEKSTETVTETPLPPENSLCKDLDNIYQNNINQRSISKIIVFYTDGSFQEVL